MNYVEEILSAIIRNEPVSPWGLHAYCPSWYGHDDGAKNLRAALNAVIRVGWVKMTEDAMLVTTSEMPADPGAEVPSSSPDEADPDESSVRPKLGRVIPLRPQPSPTDPPTNESHPEVQRESRTHVLHCAIQSEAASLSRLEDELRKYLLVSHRLRGGKVHRGVSDLLHRAKVARQEFEESDRWLQGIQDHDTAE